MSVPMQRYPIFDVATPLKDLIFYEVVDYNIKSNRDMEYGTPHHNPQVYPYHVLVYIEPNDKEAKTYRFYYAAKRENQDLYNYSSGYESIGGLMLQTVTRVYITLREDHKSFLPTANAPMPDVPEGKFAQGFILYKSTQIEAPKELKSLFVFEEHTYIYPNSAVAKEYGEIITSETTTNSVVTTGTPPDTGLPIIQSTVTPLGNGQSVKVTRQVEDGAWPNPVEHVKAKTRDNLTPQKFRNFVLTETTTTKVGSMPTTITLSINEVSKIAKKETPHRVDIKTTTEVIDSTVAPLTGSQLFFQYGGGLATTEELLVNDGTTANSGFRVLSSSVTPLGNGKSIKETVTSNADFPEISGQKYDATYDIDLPFTRQVIPASTNVVGADVTPLDQWKKQVETFDVEAIQSQLLSVHTVMPTRQVVQLPNVLKSANIAASRTLNNGDGVTIGQTSGGSVDSSVGVAADLHWDITEGYAGPAPAEVHVFFLKMDEVTINAIKAKVGAIEYPLVQPKSHRLVVTGNSATKGCSWSMSAGGGSISESGTTKPFANVVNIPPCLHEQIEVGVTYNDFEAETTLVDQYRDLVLDAYKAFVDDKIAEINSGYYNGYPIDPERQAFLITRMNSLKQTQDFLADFILEEVKVKVNGQDSYILEATSPTKITPQKYLFDTNIKVYGYGLAQITAIVVDLTDLA